MAYASNTARVGLRPAAELASLLVALALLTGCGEPVSSIEVAEETLESPADQSMPNDELIRHQAPVRAANRCLALIEATSEQTAGEVAAALKTHRIEQPGSEVRSLALQKATEVERASPLSETQINAIIEDSRIRIDTAGQAAALAPEIKRCVEDLTPIPEALEQ